MQSLLRGTKGHVETSMVQTDKAYIGSYNFSLVNAGVSLSALTADDIVP